MGQDPVQLDLSVCERMWWSISGNDSRAFYNKWSIKQPSKLASELLTSSNLISIDLKFIS